MAEDKAVEIPRVQLGSQGFEVSKLGFGCMGLSGVYNSPVPEEDGISIIKHAFSKGITFFDTADVYGPHLNEILLGKALKQLPREKVQVATKFGITGRRDPPGITVKGTPEYVRSCCEASLNRLGVDYIDLYYQHRVDTTVPIEETFLSSVFCVSLFYAVEVQNFGFRVSGFYNYKFELIGMDENRVVSDKSDLVAISDKLRLVSINEEQQETSTAENDELLKSDDELARMLQAEECAAPEDNGKVEGRLRTYASQVLMYEDLERQEAARKTVPVEELEEKALVSLAKEGNFTPSKNEQDHAFLLQLLFWFKQSFRWVNAPPCDGCGKETVFHCKADPLPSEIRYGASRVEIYGCNFCPIGSRFPRYNDPLKLVETRSGRCGEWANCFTLYCRAFGYESRLILDFTDHVWTECFSQSLGRWLHLDPCEAVYDNPMLYESGWNKKLTYVIAFTKDGVCDVTKRYTRKWHEVISRRNIITETALSAVLANVTKDCRRGFTSQVLSVLEDRDEKERQELERGLHSTDFASTSLPGRLNGDKEKAVPVSKLGFGCMGLSGVYNSPVPDEDGISIIKHAFSKGITFFDTADVYGPHLNELLLGKALKQLPREKVQVATKFGITGRRDPPGITVKGTPEYVRSCCEASLNRLGINYIDLYYQHRVDTTVPIEETVCDSLPHSAKSTITV
ncbi:hypothetical protein ACE6H2_022397 [Prunus campanulata]